MGKTIKFLHSAASCGLLGGFAAYALVLALAPQQTPQQYADMRRIISLAADVLIIPSLGVALVTGLVAMMVNRVYQERRWVWLKALLGLAMFESTLAVVQSKATFAAIASARMAEGGPADPALAEAVASEWVALAALAGLSVAQIALGVWRPSLRKPTWRKPTSRSPDAKGVSGAGPG